MNPERRSSDRFLTVVMSVLAALAAFASVAISPFFVMASDSCGISNECDESKLTWAYVVTWGGVALAVLVAVLGMLAAGRRGSAKWVWPALALVLVIVTFAGGFALAASMVN